MLAAGAGLSPIYLGPSLPVQEIVYAARKSGAKVVVLQVTDTTPGTLEQARGVLEGLPPGVELWCGGRADLNVDGAVTIREFSDLDSHFSRLAAVA
jgi:hypothetical protein